MRYRMATTLFIFLFIQCTKQIEIQNTSLEIQAFALNESIPQDPSVITDTLNNGVRYLIRTNQKPEKRAELRLVVHAGSLLESDEQQGLAHFCEHMAFNGTAHFEKQSLIDYLERIGMRFGPEVNAYTGFDDTVYMLEIPTDSIDILNTAFQILEDWAHNILFQQDEIEKERGVILEEWRLGRGASARIRDQQLPVLLYGSRYAERLPIGKPDIIRTFEPSLLHRFYRDWYRPDLISVVAVGDFDPEDIEKKIITHFSNMTNPPDPKNRPVYQVPDHDDSKISIVTDEEATQNQVSVYFKYDLSPERTIADYRRTILEYMVDSMFNERLQESLRQSNPPYLTASAGNTKITGSKGAYVLNARVDETGVIFGLENLLKEVKRVRVFGFTPTEMERSKINLLRIIEKAYLEKDKTESVRYASEYVRHFTDDEPIPGIENEYLLFLQFIPGIGLDEINGLTSLWIKDSNRVVLVSAPEKNRYLLPDETAIIQLFEDVKDIAVEPYEDVATDEPLIQAVPIPGSITRTAGIDSLGLTEWTLSNGVRVLLKPTDFKNDQILINAYSPGGSSLVPDSLYESARNASWIIQESGLCQFDRTALEKKLAGKLISISPRIDGLSEGISGQCSPEDLETCLQMVYLFFTCPRADSVAYMSLKERIRGLLENRHANPEAVYQDTIQWVMSGYHFRARPWTNERLDEINLADAFSIYRQRFENASDFKFYIVGNIDTVTIKPLILTYLGSLPALNSYESFKDPCIVPPDGIIEKTVYRGKESKSRVTMAYTGNFPWTYRREHDFDTMIQIMNIRMREVIREDLSGTYGVRVTGRVYKYPRERFDIRISFGCEPERVNELSDAVYMQIDTLLQNGPRPKDLEKVRESQLRTHEINVKNNSYWMQSLIWLDLYKLDYSVVETLPELIRSMQCDSIQEVARICFQQKNRVRVILYPENELQEQAVP
ncbi:insulinase family protein [bacterium]|nr:insulinase family protein [bacterium]